MEPDFWHQRWQNNEIGFHEPEGNPLLRKYIGLLTTTNSPCIFVPLCGKTQDIAYLLAQGCKVIGVELSELAIEQLFNELQIQPKITHDSFFTVYQAHNIKIFVGDVFALTASHLDGVTAVYDRAALVALPPKMQQQYTNHVAKITGQAPQLLLTFDYQQSLMQGPPFAVSYSKVESLYRANYQIYLLEEKQIAGGLKGKIPASALVFKLLA